MALINVITDINSKMALWKRRLEKLNTFERYRYTFPVVGEEKTQAQRINRKLK